MVLNEHWILSFPTELCTEIRYRLYQIRDVQWMNHHLFVCFFVTIYMMVSLLYVDRYLCPRESYVITVSPMLMLMEYSVLYDNSNRIFISPNYLCLYENSIIRVSENNSIYRITAIDQARNLRKV